ncbi:MAG: ABC transporter ATP-binding protein [Lachnospiraceae bacterium]|nr:ABC transporter ATP-binding protein [Lachnospiraceae bacterium]
MGKILLKAQNLKKEYGRGELAVEALKGLDFEIEEGYFYAIIGKSGSGKSTLLHLLGALDKPTSGELLLEGKSVFSMNDKEIAILRRRRIGFVFQSFNLLPEHTVMENILMSLYLDNKKPDEEQFGQIIKALGIEEKLSYYPDELSGGQRQRVAIARALITKPAILLADEPTGNLDAASGTEVLHLLKESAKKFGQTIVLVTHDMEIASKADRVIQILDGKIHAIYDNPA